MDLEPKTDGHWHFILGPVEKSIVGIFVALLSVGAVWLISSVQTLLTQQAVGNEQLKVIKAQVDGVPDLAARVTNLEYRVGQLRDDVQEIKQGDHP